MNPTDVKNEEQKTAAQEKKADNKTLSPGDLISVPFGSKFLQGVIREINPKNILINNYKTGDIRIPNNHLVYKFFPGQKFDLRELNTVDAGSKEKLTIKEKLNAFLKHTTVKDFDTLFKNKKSEVIQLLSGKPTHDIYNGQSLVSNEEKGEKSIKNWEAKFQLYRGNDGDLKIDAKFKREVLDLKVYGLEVSPEQKTALLEKNQSVTLNRTTKEGVEFKVFARLDKELNAIVTSPFTEKIEERMKNSYAKKEAESKSENKSEKETLAPTKKKSLKV